ncbi:TPA: NUDIX hydrolase [Serratia odorifera]
MTVQQILIAGPYRSGTDGDAEKIAANLHRLEQAALAVYQRGHLPVIGEWLALPLAAAAGSQQLGDEIGEAYLYPVAHRLIGRCQGIYRIEGASRGADKDIEVANALGLQVYYRLADLPDAE